MLTPEYIQRLPGRGNLMGLYTQAEADILADMARRINGYDLFIPAAQHQLKMLEEMGAVREEVMGQLSQISGKSGRELEQIMREAGMEAIRADDMIYRGAGLTPAPLSSSQAMQRTLRAGLTKTKGLFDNLTRTTANTASRQFERALDAAYMQVTAGAFSPHEAVRRAVHDLCRQGVAAIEYPSGRTDSMDVAVRRALVTGVNQTALIMQEARADELDVDLVETTAHAGARPSHALWQGRIFSRSGRSRKYPDLVSSTGYGTGAGLGGWNCSHSFRPYVEGTPRTYSKELMREYEAQDYEYNGQRMTEYEALQHQREIERNIRRWKRENQAMAAIGQDATESAAKLKQWQERQKDFLSQTGLKRQSSREQIPGWGRAQATRAAAEVSKTLLPKSGAVSIPKEKFTQYALNTQRAPDKAIAFQSALGYDISTSNALIANIRANLKRFPAVDKGDKGYGRQYEVKMELTGPNGKSAKVITAWLDDKANGEMRLVSAYVDKKGGRKD